MKQKIIRVLVGLCLLLTLHPAAAEKKVDWGMKLSIEAELPGKWNSQNASITMFSPGIGTNIGGVVTLDLGKNFYFEPEFLLFSSKYNYKDLIIQGNDGSVIEKDPKVTKWGFQIPLLIGYEINFSQRFGLDIFTGPQIRYAFAGKTHIKNKALEEEFKNVLDLWGPEGMKRFDFSWKVGIGVPVKSCVVSLEADFGITDLLKGSTTFRENRLGLGFTKYF